MSCCHRDKGANTVGHVFLLSLEEVVRIFGDSGQMENRRWPDRNWLPPPDINDQYNSNRVAYNAVEGHFRYGMPDVWWLRTPADRNRAATIIGINGSIVISFSDLVGLSPRGIRPAMWIYR